LPKQRDHGIRRVCYNCRWGRFKRRHGSLVQAGRGWCYEEAGEPPFPREWQPPKSFWNDLETGYFETDYEKFMERNAPVYWGDRLYIEQELGGDTHLSMERVKRDFQWMCWIYEHRDVVFRTSSQYGCEYHEFVKEGC
jgi:hypothetical protein